ncbi:IclR family transcriptional regulator C-terminal domain-containing protein [Streptomyces sp. NPDC004647]|uniref:IclR family transcriptional regulator n=1 Tax=Streptomyces sp. NPDC004647 TaxID=3154671 RepID=UPI0033A8D8CE
MATAGAVSPPTLIGSVQRALRLLEAVGNHSGGAPAKQLAREAGLPLPTAYHLLRTLTHEGYLRREKGLFVYGEAAATLAANSGRQRARATLAESVHALSGHLGVPVYFALYREGEIDVVSVADSPGLPAVEEWADFRQTAHAHAIGQCLLAQLDEEARQDHLSRYPVQAITPYTVRDREAMLNRLAAVQPRQPVIERQEYALGTVCAAFPVTAGAGAATMAISLPVQQAVRLGPVAEELRRRMGELLNSLSFTISI